MTDHFPDELKPEILFEDTHLVVLAKPAGLLSQGESTGDHNLVDYLRHYFGRHYVGLIHRLDRNTSGIMVIAKRSKSANRLTESLQKDEIVRTYLGWVHGSLSAPVRWEHRLLKDAEKNLVRVVSGGGAGKSQLSALTATPVRVAQWRGKSVTLVEYRLETGRSHQIRVQSAHEGHPLLGDTKYGRAADGFARTALHSHRLSFPHPMSKELMTFEAVMPGDMVDSFSMS